MNLIALQNVATIVNELMKFGIDVIIKPDSELGKITILEDWYHYEFTLTIEQWQDQNSYLRKYLPSHFNDRINARSSCYKKKNGYYYLEGGVYSMDFLVEQNKLDEKFKSRL